jgi:predicted RND superfamily exporter protein
LGRLKLEMRKGYSSRSELMQRTLKNCGEGLILTTLVLTAGFLILLASDFGGTFYIGLFSCVTLLVALICDLLLLPLILLKYLPEKYLKNLKQIPS